MNIGVHESFSTMVSSGYMPISGIVASYVSFIPVFFKGISMLFPQWLYQFAFPAIVQESSKSPSLWCFVIAAWMN